MALQGLEEIGAQHGLMMNHSGCTWTALHVTDVPTRPVPLGQVSSLSCPRASPVVSRRDAVAQPLQYCQVTSGSSCMAQRQPLLPSTAPEVPFQAA